MLYVPEHTKRWRLSEKQSVGRAPCFKDPDTHLCWLHVRGKVLFIFTP